MADEDNINEEEQEEQPEDESSESLEQENPGEGSRKNVVTDDVIHVSGMYQKWFLDYASYVILERAIPAMADGLKPVQRRILHSMKELDDGRYHKVANLIGHTMKYHPHGDAAIGDALVQLGQKELLIDTQGNWGNILTGDRAAAARYIEARLTKFALEVVFNNKTTKWLASYDGRSKEPVHLPVKFPLLLAQGAEGIAVGLSTKILPHNFNELIDASVKVLKGQNPDFVPDFPTAGAADFSQYNDGKRGGKVRVRAKVAADGKYLLKIIEIPFGTTTTTLIESILKANEKGKIKVKKVEDNTAEFVEILVHLPAGVSPDKMIDALYAFTDCEVSISPNACVIEDDKPRFVGVSEMLQISTERTKELLKLELEIRLNELQEQWHFASLEKIFIENRIYRDIEECETWEAVIQAIDKGIHKYISTPSRKSTKKGIIKLLRDVSEDDITHLTEIRIKRISKYDSLKADEQIKKIGESIKEVKNHLKNLVDYAIEYFKNLKKKYGENKKRRTEIRTFDTIQATKVAVANAKLYADYKEGFVGHGLKRTESEFVCDCSDIDDIIVIRGDGKMIITRIADKTFVGKNILHAGVWKKKDERTVYNMVYKDGKTGRSMIKRFIVTGITRDKEYDLTKGTPGTRVLYLTVNPNGEAETVNVLLRQNSRIKQLKFDFDFSELEVKSRGVKGVILSRHPVLRIELKEEGVSTLSARKIWFDDAVQRLNSDERGTYLGRFQGEDKILTIMKSGEFQLMGFDLYTKFDEDMIIIEKWKPKKPVSAIYFNGEKNQHYIKRFLIDSTPNKILFITEHKSSKLEVVTTDWRPQVQLSFAKVKGSEHKPENIIMDEFIDLKGMKTLGNQLSRHKVRGVELLEPLPHDEPDEVPEPEANSDSGKQAIEKPKMPASPPVKKSSVKEQATAKPQKVESVKDEEAVTVELDPSPGSMKKKAEQRKAALSSEKSTKKKPPAGDKTQMKLEL